MLSYRYLDKEFKSQIVINSKNYINSHFFLKNSDEEVLNDNNTISYEDGVITTINPESGMLSLSFDDGVTWINDVINVPVKNVNRIDKETFVFEIINGSNPTQFAVTYDMFMNYEVIPVGTDNDSMRMKIRNLITQRPLAFVRNSLYIFNQDEKTYSKVDIFDNEYCSLHDSSDKKSVCLFIPNSTGYSVRKFDRDDIYNILYTDLYTNTVESAWSIDVLGFNVIKATDGNDCFIIIKNNFATKIDVPSMGIFSDNEPDIIKVGFQYP